MDEMKHKPSDKWKHAIFKKGCKRLDPMKDVMRRYRRAHQRGHPKDYQWLLDKMDDLIEEREMDDARAARRGKKTDAAPGVEKPKREKSKTRDKSKSDRDKKKPDVGPDGRKICYWFLKKEGCKNGAECSFYHDEEERKKREKNGWKKPSSDKRDKSKGKKGRIRKERTERTANLRAGALAGHSVPHPHHPPDPRPPRPSRPPLPPNLVRILVKSHASFS